jgi:hypothetical protein
VPDIAQRGGLLSPMARQGAMVLLLSGLLQSLLGAALPVWRYHIQPDFLLIGTYFLVQNLGLLVALWAGERILERRGLSFGLSLTYGLAGVALFVLAASSPPAPSWGRMIGLGLVGLSAGMANMSGFHALSPAYDLHPAGTLNLAGMTFGLGCLLCALFLAGTFFVYAVPSLLILMAVAPAMACLRLSRTRLGVPATAYRFSWRELLKDFRSPAAILFALLLFFQFGNEGALAGWLALYLIQRLGISPATGLFLLALYWFSLLVGRVIVQSLLSHVSHARLLGGGVLVPMFACLVLFLTNNLFGATLAVLFAGGGFAVILPLVMERMGARFPSFHPAFMNGIFALSLTGAMLAPASLGPLANWLGIGVVAGLPLLGSVMVALLLLLIWLEAKFNAA